MPTPSRTAVLLVALSSMACAHSTSSQPIAKEKATMTTGSQTVRPRLTAEQGLLRLLELIRTSQAVTDITPERVSAVMDVPLSPRAYNNYGFGELVTPQWEHGFIAPPKFDPAKRGHETSFMYLFNEQPPGSSPDMTEICQVDFDRFTSELEAMGFARDSYYTSPPQPMPGQVPLPYGRRLYDIFERSGVANGLRIEVYPRGEANEPIDKISHRCVKQVFIY